MKRVDWNDEEISLVTQRVTDIYLSHPEYSVTKLFDEAQAVLPQDRRREITSFASAKNIYKGLSENLQRLRDGVGANGSQQNDGDSARALKEARAQIQKLEDEKGQLAAQMEAMKEQPSLPQMIAATSTSDLLYVLLARFTSSFIAERETLEEQLSEMLSKRLSGERNRIESRLFNIETALGNLTKSSSLANAPDPALSASQYMPVILVAGLTRQEFQRLQAESLQRAGVRLGKVDTSVPSKITVAPHDVLLIFQKGLSRDVVSTLTTRHKDAKLCAGTMHDLNAMIVKEAEEVRAKREK